MLINCLLCAISLVRQFFTLQAKTCENIFYRCYRGIHREYISVTANETEYDISDQCYICLDYIRCPIVTNLLSCTHNTRFHLACIWEWVTKTSVTDFNNYGAFNISCPICRKEVITPICNAPYQRRII